MSLASKEFGSLKGLNGLSWGIFSGVSCSGVVISVANPGNKMDAPYLITDTGSGKSINAKGWEVKGAGLLRTLLLCPYTEERIIDWVIWE